MSCPQSKHDDAIGAETTILGFRLVRTSSACPEQYDVFKDEVQVGYMRMRHGIFTVQAQDASGPVVYRSCPDGGGMFVDRERKGHLNAGCIALRTHLLQNDMVQAYAKHHLTCYGRQSFEFTWGTVTHPGLWACGGGRKDLLPVFLGASFQVPQPAPEEAWWCYIGPRPEFTNEAKWDENGGQQAAARLENITKNM